MDEKRKLIQTAIYRGYEIHRMNDFKGEGWYIQDGVNKLRFETLEKAKELIDQWMTRGRPSQAGGRR